MGEWKAPLSLRVRQALRAGLEELALGNLSQLLLEWSFEQLRLVGSLERLLKRSVAPSSAKRQK
jgi:hypothetical protein